MKTKTKVHRVVLLIVDHDDLGAEDVVQTLENQKFPNYCISPHVMDVTTAEVQWDDDHPLNKRDTKKKEFARLFPQP